MLDFQYVHDTDNFFNKLINIMICKNYPTETISTQTAVSVWILILKTTKDHTLTFSF